MTEFNIVSILLFFFVEKKYRLKQTSYEMEIKK